MKAKTNNPNGRPKGTGNAVAASIREQIRAGITTHDVVKSMFTKLADIDDPVKYCQTSISILEMVLPKLAPEQPEEAKNSVVDWYADIAKKMMAKAGG